MGFLAPAAPFIPMLVGAGAGALIDKDNPLRGAMLGAVGGSALGPSMAALAPAGAAASEAAVGLGATEAAAAQAAQYGAAGAATGAGFSPMQAAMLAEQTGTFGAPGLAHTLGSAGISSPIAKIGSLAVSGPQGFLGQMSKPDLMKSAGRMIMGQMNQPTPQQSPPPAVAGASPPRQAAPFQPVGRFITGMPGNFKKKDPRDDMWGYS
jgi:hypothetical protein